jgi:hypothetical protein
VEDTITIKATTAITALTNPGVDVVAAAEANITHTGAKRNKAV